MTTEAKLSKGGAAVHFAFGLFFLCVAFGLQGAAAVGNYRRSVGDSPGLVTILVEVLSWAAMAWATVFIRAGRSAFHSRVRRKFQGYRWVMLVVATFFVANMLLLCSADWGLAGIRLYRYGVETYGSFQLLRIAMVPFATACIATAFGPGTNWRV